MGIKGLTVAQHRTMERLWVQEIGGKMAWLHPKVKDALTAKGLIETNDVEVPDPLFGKMILHVTRLTIRGHMAYCYWASEQEEA